MKQFHLKLIIMFTFLAILMPSTVLGQTIAPPQTGFGQMDALGTLPGRANCGALSLAVVLDKAGRHTAARDVGRLIPGTGRGFNMHELQVLANRHGAEMAAVRIAPGDLPLVPLPAIAHKPGTAAGITGHFVVLTGVGPDAVQLYDPQSNTQSRISRSEFQNQWSDTFLIPAKGPVRPGCILDENQAASIYGGDNENSTPRGKGNGGCSGGSANGCGGGSCSLGSPTWMVNRVNLNLYIQDIPLWYTPAIGPEVQIRLAYNSEFPVGGPQIIGNKWTLNYNAHAQEDSGSGEVTVYMPDGRQDTYTPDGSGGYTRAYKSENTLTKPGAGHFELRTAEDWVYIFHIPTGASYPMLSELRNPRGQALTFGYNASGQLDTITDAMGQNTTLTYTDGRVTRVDDPFGRQALLDYDANGDLIRITDMAGYWTNLSYDADSYIASMQDNRGTTGFYIEPTGDSTRSDWYPPPGDPMLENYRITVTHPDGNKSEYYYFAQAGTGWYVSPRDYVTYKNAFVNNHAANVPKTVYIYTSNGEVVQGPREEIKSIVSPEGNCVTFTYDYQSGRRLSSTNTQSHTTNYTYNDKDRITSITGELDAPVTLVYDPVNLVDLIEVQQEGLGTLSTLRYNTYHQLVESEDRSGNIVRYAYTPQGKLERVTASVDGADRVTEYVYYGSAEPSPYRLKEVRYDSRVVSSFTYDAVGRVRTATDATGMILTYDYNDLNKVTRITYPDGKYDEITYSTCCPHLIDAVTDRGGQTTLYTYDDRKRLIETSAPDDTRTRYAYDANGNLIRLIDANDRITTFAYDSDGRLIQKTHADGKHESFIYDDIGLLVQRTNARGIITEYQYDAHQRLISIDYKDATPDVSYDYDAYGRLENHTDGIGTTAYGYDTNQRLHTVDGPWANDTLTYSYDEINRLTGITPDTGRALTHTYDTLGRLHQIQSGTDAFTYTYQSEVSPLMDRLTRPNGSYTEYHYDGLNRLERIENKTAADAVITASTLTYNDRDLIASESRTVNDAMAGFTDGLTTYTTNTVNQLTGTTDPNQSFVYDDQGNMTQGTTPDGYAYTAAYDAEDRMISIEYTDAATVVHRKEFQYGDDNFVRVIKTYENSALVDVTRILRNGFLALQERDGSNAVTSQYAWGLNMGGGIGGLLSMNRNSQNYHYLYDGKGNVDAVIDSAQAVVASYRYDTFGRLMVQSGTLDQPYQFSTKRYLADVGLNYYGYRFYSPGIGRWMNRDPLGEAGGINLYGFVQNNPVNWVDPYGLYATTMDAHAARDPVGHAALLRALGMASAAYKVHMAAQDCGDDTTGGVSGESSPATPPDPDDDDGNRFAERKLYRGAKHGLKWKEGPARATKTGNPQGQFGSRADIDWAVNRARSIRPGQSSIVELPNNHSSIVHLPDGTTVRAGRVFIKVYKNGKVHAYPMR